MYVQREVSKTLVYVGDFNKIYKMTTLKDLTRKDLEDWMSKLPPNLLDIPLSELAIPGNRSFNNIKLLPDIRYPKINISDFSLTCATWYTFIFMDIGSIICFTGFETLLFCRHVLI